MTDEETRMYVTHFVYQLSRANDDDEFSVSQKIMKKRGMEARAQ
jgi:hypothetical protein